MTAEPWAFEIDPGVVALCGGLAAAYVVAWRRLGPRWAPRPEQPVTRFQAAVFAAGLASLVLAVGWPLHRLGEEYLFTAHMVQHLVIGYVTAPLLLLGTPGWMLRVAVGDGLVFRGVRWFTRPLVAFGLFNLSIVLLHWPDLVDLSLRSDAVHAGLHGFLLAVSLAVWMPVVSPLPELPRLLPPVNLLYLFGQSILPTVPASFLTFGETVLYDFYARVPRLWDVSAMTDQQVAGLVMKVGGGFLLWGMITVLFFVWQADEERRNRGPAHLDVDELELELSEVKAVP